MQLILTLATNEAEFGVQSIAVWIIVAVTVVAFGLQIRQWWRRSFRAGSSGCGGSCACGKSKNHAQPDPK